MPLTVPEVDDLEVVHRELTASGGSPGEFGIDKWDGRSFHTFLVREKANGDCCCFNCPAAQE
jgi:hypothetical protein